MATAGAKTTIKPFKLKPSSGDSITRDDLATWREVLLSHMRQNEKWKDFLPGGTKEEWNAIALFTACFQTCPQTDYQI